MRLFSPLMPCIAWGGGGYYIVDFENQNNYFIETKWTFACDAPYFLNSLSSTAMSAGFRLYVTYNGKKTILFENRGVTGNIRLEGIIPEGATIVGEVIDSGWEVRVSVNLARVIQLNT